jgi:chromate reductase
VRILGISGSLQRNSTNTALVDIARARAPEGVEVQRFDGLAAIPPCNPELEPAPPEVEAFRSLVQSADGLLIATPEYAHGLPGMLKNALDWLVGSGELYGKRVVVVSAAPSSDRGAYARADLERTLRAQGADVLASSTIAVPTSARGREIDDPEIVAAVDAVLAALVPRP